MVVTHCNPTKCGCNTWVDEGDLTMTGVERIELGGGGGGRGDGGRAVSGSVEGVSDVRC